MGLSFQNLGDFSLEAALTTFALVATLTLWLVDRLVFQRRRIAYRVQMDAPVHLTPAIAMVDVELRRHGTVVRDASLVLLRVDNVGGKDLEPRDIHHPLSFRFPGRQILGLEVTNPDPPDLKDMLLGGLQGDAFIGRDHIELPKTALNRGNSFKLFVLLTGTGSGVSHAGFLSGGGRGSGIRRDTRGRMPRGRGSVYATVSVGLAGILMGILLIVGGPTGTPGHCAAGRLEIVGSSAFESAVRELRGAYVAECAAFRVTPDIEINTTGSRTGTKTLHDRGQQGERVADVVAMSDGAADPGIRSLRGVSVAVLVLAVVVHDTAGVTSLSTDQLPA